MTDAWLSELFSRTFHTDGGFSDPVIATTNGRRITLFAFGELMHYGF